LFLFLSTAAVPVVIAVDKNEYTVVVVFVMMTMMTMTTMIAVETLGQPSFLFSRIVFAYLLVERIDV
jgi:hypothetical protein